MAGTTSVDPPGHRYRRPGGARRRCRRAEDRCIENRRTERGSASLEIAILAPALLALTFAVVQAGLWFHARSLALAAAQEGVTAARAYHAPTDAGPTRARAFLTQQAGDSLLGATVTTAGTTATVVRVTVRGHALSVLPGVRGPTITQSAQAGRERFTTPGGAP